MRRWRTMFSTSTMASSTRMPTTSESASSVMMLIEKPSMYMPMNAGSTDSGSATAETMVARQLRRNSHTTTTARMAPSYSRCMELSYSSLAISTKSTVRVRCRSGCSATSWSSARCTPAPTSTSLAPRLRETSKPITGLPSSRAPVRGSATVSVTVAIRSRRTWPPPDSGMSSAAISCAVRTVAMVRTGCSAPPRSVRPPALSVCTRRSWRETSAAVAPRACRRSGSMATRTSRCTPPTRPTAPTPGTARRRRVRVSSTNQDSAWSSMRSDAMAKARMGCEESSSLVTMGSRRSAGMSARTRETAERTSSTASCTGFSRRYSAAMVAVPSTMVVVMCLRPCVVAMAFSILRATSVSSWPGAAPGRAAVTITTGRSMSGKFCTFIARNDSRPAKVSSTNSIAAGMGLRMDQAERFMAAGSRGSGGNADAAWAGDSFFSIARRRRSSRSMRRRRARPPRMPRRARCRRR